MSRCLAAVVFVVVAMNMTACKIGKRPTRKEVTIEKKDSTVVAAPAPSVPAMPVITPEKRALIDNLMPIWANQISFNTFSGKAKMHYEGNGQKHEFTANFRIQKDQIIWVSVSAFLLPVARVYITPDSLQLVNYLNKEAFQMPIADANKLLPAPVDFQILQNFIVGNALKSVANATDATDFGGTWNLQTEAPGMIQQATYNKADTTMRALQIRTPDNNTQGVIQYGNYGAIAGRKFSDTRAVNLTNNGIQYYLDMNFNNVEFDQPLEFPFSIPKNYKIK